MKEAEREDVEVMQEEDFPSSSGRTSRATHPETASELNLHAPQSKQYWVLCMLHPCVRCGFC